MSEISAPEGLKNEARSTYLDGRNFPARWATPEEREQLVAYVRKLRADGLTHRQIVARLEREGVRRSFGWVWNATQPAK